MKGAAGIDEFSYRPGWCPRVVIQNPPSCVTDVLTLAVQILLALPLAYISSGAHDRTGAQSKWSSEAEGMGKGLLSILSKCWSSGASVFAQQNEVATSTHLLVVGETLRICRYLASSLQREKDLSQ